MNSMQLFSMLVVSSGPLLRHLHWPLLLLAFLLFGISAVFVNEINWSAKKSSMLRQRRRLLRQHLIASMQGLALKPLSGKMPSASLPQLSESGTPTLGAMLAKFGKRCVTITASVTNRVRHSGDASRGTTSGVYAPFLFAVSACALVLLYFIIHPPVRLLKYDCYNPESGQPRTCFEVRRSEGGNAYEMCDVAASPMNCMEMRFCKDVSAKLYAGYFVSRLYFSQTAGCQSVAPPGMYKIVRARDKQWKLLRYSALSYDDVLTPDGKVDLSRPVLDKRCRDTPDDADTVCNFDDEVSQR